MSYVAGRNYYRAGVLIPSGEPVPEVAQVTDIVLDRLLRLGFVRKSEAEEKAVSVAAAKPLKGRPPIQGA